MPGLQGEQTAIVYCRVSTVKQAEEELPIASQQERCEAKAASLGATVLRVFADEGLSGQSDSRPAFQQALLFCETHSPTYLITWSTSRFARNMFDAQLYKRRLGKTGTELVYASLEIDRDSQGGWLTERTMELFDEFYSRQVSADTRRSMIKAAQSGYWNGGRPPYGYRPVAALDDSKRKRLEPVPDEADVVQRIFKLRAQGLGAKTIAVQLNNERCLHRHALWNKTSVLSLLRNQVVIGNLVFGRSIRASGEKRRTDPKDWIVVPSHQPIVARDLWDTVQTLIDADAPDLEAEAGQSKGSPHSTFLFTGLLRCGRCGASLQIETAKGRSRRYSYYNCRNAQRKGSCPPRRLPARELDEWLFKIITYDLLAPRNLEQFVQGLREQVESWESKRVERRLIIERKIKSTAKCSEKIYEILELFGKETPNLDELFQRLKDNKAQVETLTMELAKIDAEEAPHFSLTKADIANLLIKTMQDPSNVSKTRALFADFIRKIEVKEDAVFIEYKENKIIKKIPDDLGEDDLDTLLHF